MSRSIKVTGTAKVLKAPDQICLKLDLNGIEKTYEETWLLSSKKTEQLKDSLERIGFPRTALKTLSFRIDTKSESYKDKDKTWKTRLAGYEFAHSLKLEFDLDHQLLGKTLSALAACLAAPRFQIQYTVKDPIAAKNEALQKAVMDSKRKAQLLAEASNVVLGEIQSIDYSWCDINLISRSEPCLAAGAFLEEDTETGVRLDLEPEDLTLTDTVTVVWEIL